MAVSGPTLTHRLFASFLAFRTRIFGIDCFGQKSVAKKLVADVRPKNEPATNGILSI